MSKELREEAQKYVTEDIIKQIYFHCENKLPEGIYPEEIELIEFSEKLILAVAPAVAKAERDECLKIVQSLNPEVARVVRERRG